MVLAVKSTVGMSQFNIHDNASVEFAVACGFIRKLNYLHALLDELDQYFLQSSTSGFLAFTLVF